MSKLRKELQQARHQYQHQRYPGDLADELLGRSDAMEPRFPAKKPSQWVRALSLAAALAIVATAAIVLILSNSKTTTSDNVAIVMQPTLNTAVTPTTAPVDLNTDPVNAAGTGETEADVEERLSLVPSQVASSQEVSFSLVPSLSSMSWTEMESAEDQTAEQQSGS